MLQKGHTTQNETILLKGAMKHYLSKSMFAINEITFNEPKKFFQLDPQIIKVLL